MLLQAHGYGLKGLNANSKGLVSHVQYARIFIFPACTAFSVDL